MTLTPMSITKEHFFLLTGRKMKHRLKKVSPEKDIINSRWSAVVGMLQAVVVKRSFNALYGLKIEIWCLRLMDGLFCRFENELCRCVVIRYYFVDKSSVTRLGNFLKVLRSKLSFKSSPNIWWLFGYFLNITF